MTKRSMRGGGGREGYNNKKQENYGSATGPLKRGGAAHNCFSKKEKILVSAHDCRCALRSPVGASGVARTGINAVVAPSGVGIHLGVAVPFPLSGDVGIQMRVVCIELALVVCTMSLVLVLTPQGLGPPPVVHSVYLVLTGHVQRSCGGLDVRRTVHSNVVGTRVSVNVSHCVEGGLGTG